MTCTTSITQKVLLFFLGISISLSAMDSQLLVSNDHQLQEEQQQAKKIKEELEGKMAQLQAQEDATRLVAQKKLQKVLYAGTLLGAGCGFSLAHFTYRFIVKPALKKSEVNRFFTGLEIPAAFSAVKAVLTPIICLALAGYAYYTIKNYFVEPYIREHREQWERNKEILLKEKAEITQSNQVFMSRMQNEVMQLRTNVVTSHQQVDEVLGKMQAENKELREAFLKVTSQTSVDLAGIQKHVSELGKTNTELKGKVAEVNPKIETVLANVQKMSKQIERELQVMQKQGEAIKKLQEEMKNKKDKKESKKGIADFSGLFGSGGNK